MDIRTSDRLAFAGALASGLAHEIKNPLSTMKLNLQLLKEELGKLALADAQDQGRAKASRRIDRVLGEVRRLENVLGDFLRYARGHDLSLRPVRLNLLMEQILDFFAPEAMAGKIKMMTRWDPEVPEIVIDPDYFKQCVYNVLLNARQAMPDGGELFVETRRDGPSVLIDITDTGGGIEPNRLEKVWNVYYSTKKGGTGLGLPMVRRIVEEHGGSVEIQSEVDRGTRLRIRLPLAGSGGDEGCEHAVVGSGATTEVGGGLQ